MQRRKHIQLDLRGHLFRAEPRTTVKKGTDTERREGQQEPTQQGQGAGQRVEKQRHWFFVFFFKKGERASRTFFLTFYSLTLHVVYFVVTIFMGESIHQQSWDQSPLDAFHSEAHF